MTLTLPRRAVVDPDELPATVSAPPASPTATDDPSGRPSDPEREWLRKLNWGLFETLVESAFSRDGFTVEAPPQRLNGRADMLLKRRGEQLLVQCKHWKAWQVGTPAVTELRELVDEAGLDNGMLITAGKFTAEAAELAAESGLLLLDGDDLLRMAAGGPVLPLADETTSQWALPKEWTAFGAPTCPLCEAPMMYKRVRAGKHTGMRFWGCRNYPTCRAIREVGPAYAGLPLERPAPDSDSDPVAEDTAVTQDVAPSEDVAAVDDVAVATALVGPSDAAGVETDFEASGDGEAVDPDALAQVSPAAPLSAAAVVAALPMAPPPVASVPVLPLPAAPLPAAPVIESEPGESELGESELGESELGESASVEDGADEGKAVALPVAPPPGVTPVAEGPSALVPVVDESSTAAPTALLPPAPVPQSAPPELAVIAEPSPELTVPSSVASEQAPVADVPVPPASNAPAATTSAAIAPAATAPASDVPAATTPAPMPSAAPSLPVPAPIAPLPAPAPAPVAPTVPVEVSSPGTPSLAGAVANASFTPPEPERAESVAEADGPHAASAAADDAPASPLGRADLDSSELEPAEPQLPEPERPEPELAEPELIVRRRAELGLPELHLPPGAEDSSYRVLLAHPTWSDPRDEEDDVPSFVPEEHAPYQWPTSADLIDEGRAPISWPESAPEPVTEAVAEVAGASRSRRRQYLMIGAVLAVAAVLTIAVAVLIPAVMSAMKLIMH